MYTSYLSTPNPRVTVERKLKLLFYLLGFWVRSQLLLGKALRMFSQGVRVKQGCVYSHAGVNRICII